MTDSSTPIEMSWDWGCDGQKPAIRYSVEPIGRDAGTAADPLNEFAASRLIDQFRRIFSETDLMWYDHFSKELAVFDSTSDTGNGNETTEAHQSRIFVAFDLREDDVMLKAYFFPTFKATQTGQSNLTVTIDAIVNLPHCPSFPAFAVLENYIRTLDSGSHLGVEILGIDCEAPAKSRLKIYARSPATNFKSVRATMTLGARIDEPGLDQGFQELRQIWKLVLGKGKEFCDIDNLECIDHRTARMLYYFEFKSGQALPTSKVYLPVRHYGQNDLAIVLGLKTYLESRGQGSLACQYIEALRSIR